MRADPSLFAVLGAFVRVEGTSRNPLVNVQSSDTLCILRYRCSHWRLPDGGGSGGGGTVAAAR